MLKNGLFIAFEGVDGCGKTTQMEMLVEYLEKLGLKTVLTREPGGTQIGEKIRKILLDPKNSIMDAKTEALLYAASRAQHINEKIKPALESGKIVICDRFVYSSIVYQGFARKLGMDTVKELNDFAIDDVYPNLTFYLNLPVDISLKRMDNKKLDRIEKEGINFQMKVREGYQKLVADTRNNMVEIDARGKRVDVFSRIKVQIDKTIKRRNLL